MKSTRRKVVLVSLLVVVVAFSNYFTFAENAYYPEYIYYHTLFRDLYFLPLILAGLWFGLKGALYTSLATTVFYVPFLLMNWQGLSPTDFSRILELLVFNSVALVLGAVSGREKARERVLRESENLAAIGRAVSALAHDMRNPLVAIGGVTRLVQKRLTADDDINKKLSLVITATDRLEVMVKDMLDFSRPLKLDLSREDMNEMVRRSILLLEKQAKDKQVNIETELSTELSPFDFDAVRIEQVLVNLVSNAIEASPESDTIRIRVYEKGKAIFVEIVDHGTGIPPENREKIFTAFFTTKSRGTGLGLAIVAKIVEAHHGRVEALENPDGGTIFRIILPARKPDTIIAQGR
jgi:two-component system, NtrC family, sensor histidine kinase HydH